MKRKKGRIRSYALANSVQRLRKVFTLLFICYSVIIRPLMYVHVASGILEAPSGHVCSAGEDEWARVIHDVGLRFVFWELLHE